MKLNEKKECAANVCARVLMASRERWKKKMRGDDGALLFNAERGIRRAG
jgi:hypothetical protein